jgi:hypothetical protein
MEELSKITMVLTSCGRNDLLEKTLDSFFKYNTYPIERYIIIEDSADFIIFNECERLNKEKYDGKLEFIFNYEKLGQCASIDKAYSIVETEYVFHCEEDWEFYRDGFIEESIKVLKTQPKVIQAWIRPKSDNILNKIQSNIYTLPFGVSVRIVEPVGFIVRGANDDGSDMIIKNYMGFSWNPGVKRIKDWKELSNGYSGFEREHLVDQYYRDNGFMVVSLSKDDTDGYVKHIGWNRRAANPVYKSSKPKISIIMQSYLSDYPGSRKNPIDKFKRAVRSFQEQIYKNIELVIVSDGCDITYNVYKEEFKEDKSIKFILIDKKDTPNMYELKDGQKYYRGLPRKIGVEMADGELITYMDSDDYLLPNFTMTIVTNYNLNPNKDWWINRTWYDNTSMKLPDNSILNDTTNLERFKIDGLDSEWIKMSLKFNRVVLAPWLFIHKSSCNTKWCDTVGEVSEDVDFNKRLRGEYKNGSTFEEPVYVRCHYSGIWDY